MVLSLDSLRLGWIDPTCYCFTEVSAPFFAYFFTGFYPSFVYGCFCYTFFSSFFASFFAYGFLTYEFTGV
jgi:hypothetical protein